MIRLANAGDIPAMIDMMGRFRAEVSLCDGIPYHAPTFAETIAGLIASQRGLALVLDGAEGMFLASASPSPFAPVLVADEVIFWVGAQDRGRWAVRMIDFYEAWATGIGARVIGLNYSGKSAAALYTRRGYRPAEHKFVKVI